MSTKRSTRERKKNSDVTRALEQLKRVKQGKEGRTDQYVPEHDLIDENILEEDVTRIQQMKKAATKKRKKKEVVTAPNSIPSMFSKSKTLTSGVSPPKKKQKQSDEAYLKNVLAMFDDDDEGDNEEKEPQLPLRSDTQITSTDMEISPEKEKDPSTDESKKHDIDDSILEEFDEEEFIKKSSHKRTTTPKEVSMPPLKPKKPKPATVSNIQIKMPKIPALGTNPDLEDTVKYNGDRLEFYLVDAHTERYREETVFLFGKVYDEKSKSFVSCCVSVNDLQRSVYFLCKNQSGDEEEMLSEVTPEIEAVCRANRIKMEDVQYRLVQKNYAFEEPGVPHEKQWYVQMVYSARLPVLQYDCKKSKVFLHMFGARTSTLELFLLENKIQGPCWLEIKELNKVREIFSWCRYEVACTSESISVMKTQKPSPPLRVMSLKLKTFLNDMKRQNEIVMASAICHEEVRIDGPTPNAEKKFKKFTAIRRIDKLGSIPNAPNIGNHIEICQTEQALLNFLVAKIHSFDPDVIVGHNFLAYDLDVFLHRMKSLNMPHWSKIGRLRRTTMPKLQQGPGGLGASTWEEKIVMSGRLVCDTYISAQEYLRESSYALHNLAVSQLNVNPENIFVIDNDLDAITPYMKTASGIAKFAENNEYFAYLSMMLMFKLSLLPLTKELTAVAGNLWSRTLTGSRAERIEYLLLHEFYNRDYIVPDKQYQKKSESSDDGTKTAKRKAKYSGGLVIDPKRGLYDKYVLLLDFNSLYPSIILEKNLCFTTVKRNLEGKDEEPQVMEDEENKSVLPVVVKSLLDRRKIVKDLMKNEKDSAKRWQYDIRQKALKLTANSTYGCLGFTQSRFYCKAIAELITSNGRAILNQTKNEIEKLGQSVIYGDTDSVMILTPHTDFKKALQLGQKIKNHINKKRKFLQIDVEGLFRRILLLTKKKYAAIMDIEDPHEPGQIISKREIKGLDMVRRDWCPLSKQVSNFCVDQILSGKPSEEVIKSIHEHLQQVGNMVRAGTVPLEKFILTKSLTKDPKDYPDAKILPHVVVAQKMARDLKLPVRVGERIPYLICRRKGKNEGTKHIADQAYHPQEYEQLKDFIEIDADWYLANQVHPPVLRLCEHIEGTDSALLAECLGLDKSKFASYSTFNEDDFNDTVFDDEKEKYKNVTFNSIPCSNCGKMIEFAFEKILVHFANENKSTGITDCSTLLLCQECHSPISVGRVFNCVQKNIRAALQKYYQGYMITQSGGRTRVPSITPECAFHSGHPSHATVEFTHGDLYLHLSFYKNLFDFNKCIEKANVLAGGEFGELKEHLDKIIEEVKSGDALRELKMIQRKIDHYLENNARRFINLDSIFSFYKVDE